VYARVSDLSPNAHKSRSVY